MTDKTTGIKEENTKLKKEIEILKREIQNLREAEEKYRRIFETVPASIYVVDKNGIIIEINPYHIKQMGQGKTSKEDYLNSNVLMRPTIIQASLVNKFKGVLTGDELDEKEVYMPITSGGPDAYVNIRGVPLYQNGEIIGAIFISENVTQLKKDQEELIRYREHLEEIIEARTQELQCAYRELQQENTERQKAEAEKEIIIDSLQTALAQVKKLSGLLPICASCKQIRDDEGYWHQVEVYIRDHSEVQFSHGICPDCMMKLYPDYVSKHK
jgi:PAS domain S-box-containing protein